MVTTSTTTIFFYDDNNDNAKDTPDPYYRLIYPPDPNKVCSAPFLYSRYAFAIRVLSTAATGACATVFCDRCSKPVPALIDENGWFDRPSLVSPRSSPHICHYQFRPPPAPDPLDTSSSICCRFPAPNTPSLH
eukprot:2766075-Ditylum_brightwellii.AAC.1